MTDDSDYTQDPVCRICGVLYAKHPQCECCGIYCGPNHFREGVSRYRGHRLCDHCIEAWPALEEKLGRVVLWLPFKNRDREYRAGGRNLKGAR